MIDPAFAQTRPGTVGTGTMRGAPGPIAGAGLPVLVVGGIGYWLWKRRRQKKAD
jgi:LPXTG-motif cell wall-anchored protein